ncbi:hypothetical protein CAI16_05245 [Virgibacillus dokdonensis]|uniref:Uncharacterized protein n=1 Tax=Virgibacillus dokdonensis TaxID=302167 RepID=A0A3E0WUY8_9BACI|nr:hypothetical protein [Virgibacillus dokdonensis]RFA36199.1 hypothetical protein CAI16_05245 [Virgibacillus dokdonensis]
MDYEKLFSEEDIPEAKKRFARITNLLDWVSRYLKTSDLTLARDHLSEAFVEINNLVDLNKEKQGKEQLIRLADELSELGIDPLKVLGDKYAMDKTDLFYQICFIATLVFLQIAIRLSV